MARGGRKFREGNPQAGVRAEADFSDLQDQFSRGRATVARATRAWWLLIPLPLLFLAVIVKGFGQDWLGLITVLFALYAVVQGWWLIRRGLAVQAKDAHKNIYPGRFPWRILGSVVIGAAGFALAFVFSPGAGFIGQLFGALMAGLLLAGAMLLAFGFDKVAAQGVAEAAKAAGMPQSDLLKAFKEANGKIDTLAASAASTKDEALRHRLFEIVASARRVIRQIEEDPKDLRRARRFLASYLDSATRIAQDFQANQARLSATEIKAKYSALLDTIQETFTAQEQKLDRDDHMDLDVRIDVLKTQMQREGL